MVKADLGIGFVPEDFLASVEGVPVIETEKPLPEREIRVVKRKNRHSASPLKNLSGLFASVKESFFQ